MDPVDKVSKKLSRREALKAMLAAGGASAMATLPHRWEKPTVTIGTLPVFAQTSPNQYPFTHTVESIELSGPDSDKLQVAQYPGWFVISEKSAAKAGGLAKAMPAPQMGGRPWIYIKRKWEVFQPPWQPVITVKIKIKFHPLPGFKETEVPEDDTDFWFFGMAGANFVPGTVVFPWYYVTKLKIKKNQIEIEFWLPAFGSGLYPFYLSGYFPFTIILLTGFTLFPGYYVGPGIFGDQVGSSWLDD